MQVLIDSCTEEKLIDAKKDEIYLNKSEEFKAEKQLSFRVRACLAMFQKVSREINQISQTGNENEHFLVHSR